MGIGERSEETLAPRFLPSEASVKRSLLESEESGLVSQMEFMFGY
jgi:hypothetical protein